MCGLGPWVSLADSSTHGWVLGRPLAWERAQPSLVASESSRDDDSQRRHDLYHACMTQPDTSLVLEVFLEDRDEACPSCGYNLRGLKATECPECERTGAA